MRRIREGNDFNVAWKIFQAGVAVDLSQVTEKKLSYSVYGKKTEYTNYTVSGQTLTIEFPKEVTTARGDYRLIFEYTIPDSGQSDGDLKRTTDVVAFRIVQFTADADTDMTVNVSSDVAIAFKGDRGDPGYDAYHIWLDLGNTGTYEDYIAWLRQPAVDAGASIAELEATIEGNESDRVVAENERDGAEGLRVQAETLRSNAESGRVTAEGLRDDAEALRITEEGIRADNEGGRIASELERIEAEGLRNTAELLREAAETERDTSEGIRVSAETARQTNTATAISNANIATSAANTAAGYATEQGDYAKEQANYAKAQGNYAKEQGEYVAGLQILNSVVYDETEFNEI